MYSAGAFHPQLSFVFEVPAATAHVITVNTFQLQEKLLNVISDLQIKLS